MKRTVLFTIILLLAACGGVVPEPISSVALTSEQIVAKFEIRDFGEGPLVASALLVVAGEAAPEGVLHYEPRAHVLLGADSSDRLTVQGREGESELVRVLDAEHEGKFLYSAQLERGDRGPFRFVFSHGDRALISTVSMPEPFLLIEPAAGSALPAEGAVKVIYEASGRAPSSVQLDAPCAKSNALVVGPEAAGDTWRTIVLSKRAGVDSAGCAGELDVRFKSKGEIDPGFADVDVVQSSRISAFQERAHPVMIVEP